MKRKRDAAAQGNGVAWADLEKEVRRWQRNQEWTRRHMKGVYFRLSERQYLLLRDAAENCNMSLYAWAKAVVLDALEEYRRSNTRTPVR